MVTFAQSNPVKLNFEFFIAKGILSKDKNNFSRPIVRISVISIALGIAVMIISIAVTTGFKSAISDKVIGFGSDIQITNYDLNKSSETAPISKSQTFYPSLEKTPGIRHIQVFATKSGLIKTADQIQGVVFKGIGEDFDWSFFKDKIIEGRPLIIDSAVRNDSILISRKITNLLKLRLGDEVRMYFVNEDEMQPRGRKFIIGGIYETGLEEFDDTYVIGDLKQIQRLNNWTNDQVSGFEIFIDNFRDINKMTEKVLDLVGYDLNATSIRDLYPQIFEWLDLQDINVIIILILMVAVAIINMVSTLLILIIEKTNMIGILKSLGAQNLSIRKVFLYHAAFIIGRGMLWGNIIGLSLAIVQYRFHLFKLPQESYYVPFVPINLDILPVILINAGTLLVCVLFLLVPSYVITKISPIKAIRYE